MLSLFFRKRNLLNIKKIQFNRRRASEDRDGHLQRGFLFVNFLNLAGEALERTRFNAHCFARRVRELRLRLLFSRGLLISDLIHFFRRQRRRMLAANEACDFRGRTNRVKNIVGNMTLLVAINLDQPNTQPVYNVISTLVYSAHSGQVSHVWVHGQLLVEDGQLTRIDKKQLLDTTREWGKRIGTGPKKEAAQS